MPGVRFLEVVLRRFGGASAEHLAHSCGPVFFNCSKTATNLKSSATTEAREDLYIPNLQP